MSRRESKVETYYDTLSSGDSNNMISKQKSKEVNNNEVDELSKELSEMGCIVEAMKRPPNICVETCIYESDAESVKSHNDEEEAYSDEFEDDKSEEEASVKTVSKAKSDGDREENQSSIKLSKSQSSVCSNKAPASISGRSGRSDFGSVSVPQTRRINMSFTNERLREIERHNHILLTKILSARNVKKSSIPAREQLAKKPVPSAAVTRKNQQQRIDRDNMLGKQRSYNLGKFIRARYDELLSEQYNRSEIYIRSTDSTRAKMTVLTAMAAVYPAYPGSWSDEVNWVPTPYTTVTAKYDYNEALLNCPIWMSIFTSLTYADSSNMSGFFDVLNVISEQLGYNITSTPNLVYAIYDVYVTQNNLGVALSEDIAANLDRISDAADVTIDNIYGNADYMTYMAGPLLNEFFSYADEQIAGTDTPSVRVYSAHDTNVYSLMTVVQITPRQGLPEFASAFALELRQVVETGEYVVLPVYEPSPGDDLVYLSVAGCGESVLCPYDIYKDIVSPYVLDEDTWRTNCGFTEDLIVDDSGVAK